MISGSGVGWGGNGLSIKYAGVHLTEHHVHTTYTATSVLLDTDAESLLAEAAEEEGRAGSSGSSPSSSKAAAGGAAAAAVSFTPVHGTGVVFFLDGAGALRGVLVWGLVPLAAAGGDDR